MAAPTTVQGREFPETIWEVISRAKRRSAGALNEVFGRYRAPVYSYLRLHGIQRADAEDLTQDVFRRIVEGGLLQKVRREKGRFRNLLVGITKNVLRERRRYEGAGKRGGGRRHRSIEEAEEGAIPLAQMAPAGEGEDSRFDMLWVLNLVNRAIERLRREDPRGELYAALLDLRALKQAGHEEIARRLDLKVSDVKNYLHRARSRIGAYVHEAIQAYSSSREDYEAEARYLSRFLPRGTTEGMVGREAGADEIAPPT